MRLSQIIGNNPSGIGFWTHVLPTGNVCVTMGKRMLVTAPGVDDYWVHEDGVVELAKAYPKLHQDND